MFFVVTVVLAATVAGLLQVSTPPLLLAANALRYTAYAAGFACLIWLAATSRANSVIARLLTLRPLRTLGKYSYGIYVLHIPMIPILYVLLQRVFRACHWKNPSELATIITFDVVGTGCSVGAAMLSWHLFEKRFLKLKSRFSYGVRRD
jgi:peptidoglycan/LPS O-acetylase OafA/YrhL